MLEVNNMIDRIRFSLCNFRFNLLTLRKNHLKANFKSTSITFLGLCLMVLLFPSCAYKKKVIYFQGAFKSDTSNVNYIKLKPGDVVSIQVVGLDEASVKPFNLPTTNFNQNLGGYVQGTPSPPGYLINQKGVIDFPIIGELKVGGLTIPESVTLLKDTLKPYVKSPTILIRILNFKVTVLGEVRNPGTFTIPNERITLLEAIGLAGDLQITGKRDNVIIIREVDGKKSQARINLTNNDLFNTDYYYLEQNDVVYIEPNRAKINSSVINPSNVSLVISIISLFVTMGILFSR